MTDHTCACGRPLRDTQTFCDDCGRAFAVALGDVAWLEEELETTITRAKGVDYRTKGGTRSSDKPMPYAATPAEARGHLRAILVAWTKFCAEERVRNSAPSQDLPQDTLTAMSRFLLWRVDGLAVHDIGPEAVDEVIAAVANCHRMIDRPAEKLYAGRCGAEVESGECEADLYAKQGSKSVVCRACDTTWDVKERREFLLREAEEVLATAVEISRAVSWLGAEPLTADRVRQWASRGRLLAKGHDHDKRPLYRVGDAIDLLSQTTRKPGAA